VQRCKPTRKQHVTYTTVTDLEEERYVSWLESLVITDEDLWAYDSLLRFLYTKDFYWLVDMDSNRAEDGLRLRHCNLEISLDRPCSVLEMMIALAYRCEDDVMSDPKYGDRTQVWFWNMIDNLGLAGMTNDQFSPKIANDIVDKFLERAYEPSGKGSLFMVNRPDIDMRNVEIWYQMHAWLNENFAF
jgi:hypothetical protein